MTTRAASRSPTLSEVLRNAIEYQLEDLHVAMPGMVTEYDPAEQRAQVQPLLQRRVALEDGEELLETLPVIPDVPVAFPRSDKFFLSFPIEPGDLGTLIFSERSLDNFLDGAGDRPVDPDEFRRHDLTDAVFYPGGYPWKRAIKEAHSANLVVGKDEGGLQIHITPSGEMEIKVNGTADEIAVLGNALQTFWNGTLKTAYDAHVHPTGVGPSGPPAPLLLTFPTGALSSILKLKSG